MNRDYCEAVRLDTQGALTIGELERMSGLAESVLRELVDYGALQPMDASAATWTFESDVVAVVRTAGRLHRDFELDPHALAVVLRFMEQVDTLEAEIRSLRARLLR